MYKRDIGNVFVQLDSPNIRGSFTTSIENIEGIKLTEEKLLKCGAKRVNYIHGYSFFTFSNSKINKIHIDIYENRTQYYGYSCKHCESIHQLQNLYFALVGEELEINL